MKYTYLSAALPLLGSLCPLQAQTFTPTATALPDIWAIDPIATDVNGDGRSDLLSATLTEAPRVLLAQQDGSFQPLLGPSVSLTSIRFVRSCDLTGNGIADLLYVSFDSTISQYVVTPMAGNGDGTFQIATGSPLGLPSSAQLVNVFVGDVNGDGLDCDIVTLSDDLLAVRLQQAVSLLPLVVSASLPLADVGESAMFDFDSDGDLDFIVAEASGDDIFTYSFDAVLNSIDLLTEVPIGLGSPATAVVPIDLDADPDLELVVSRSAEQELYFFDNDSLGFFATLGAPVFEPGLQTGGFPVASNSILVGKFDSDDTDDFILSRTALIECYTGGGADAALYLGSTIPGLVPSFAADVPSSLGNTLVRGDFDGDGRTDAAGWCPLFGGTSVGSVVREPAFRRGDANNDGDVDSGDVGFMFSSLFEPGGPDAPCPDAFDANDDGNIDVSDSIFLLAFLFSGGPPPPAPGPVACGLDPTPDSLSSVGYDLTLCP